VPHKRRIITSLALLAYTTNYTAPDTVGLLFCHVAVLWHAQIAVHQHPRSFPAELFPNSLCPSLNSSSGLKPSQVQDFAFVLDEFHDVAVSPFLQLVCMAARPSSIPARCHL